MDDVLFLELASPFLTRCDILACCKTTRLNHEVRSLDLAVLRFTPMREVPGWRHAKHLLPGTIRLTAAAKLGRWWRRSLTRRWLDLVAWSAARMHAFPHRTRANYPPWRRHFDGGLAGIGRIMATVRFTPAALSVPLWCPVCHKAPVTCAWYYWIGTKMARSSPYISIGCASCSMAERGYRDDVVQVSYFASWLEKGCRAELAWIDQEYEE